MPADVGTGSSITFGTSSFDGEVLSISANGMTRPVIDTTHMETEDARTKMPGDLVDSGDVTVEIQFDPNNPPPIDAAPETITITFPVATGDLSGATLAGTGFISSTNWTAPLEDKMVGSYTITWSGEATYTGGT